MNANFKYTTMTITGAMHLAIGILCIIFSIVGFAVRAYKSYESYDSIHGRYYDYIRTYPSKGTAAGSFITSLWIIAVGIIGIITGNKSNPLTKTHTMRTVYLIFNILSAAVFSVGGIISFTTHGIWMARTYLCILFFFGVFLMVMEFILAIVTSSICCCCSGINENTTTRQIPGVPQPTIPSVIVCQSDANASLMPPQYTPYPSYGAGAQMPPQYNATAPDLAENAMPIPK